MSGIKVGLVGARGHTGAELIRLFSAHPRFELAFVTSRELDGQRVADHNDGFAGELRYCNPAHEELPTLGADAVVLALPNGKAAHIVQQFDDAGADPVLVDLSADYRFDPSWYYGLPELTRTRYAGQRRISNPGCYATAMQLAIAPMSNVLQGPVQCFGVSGYSGAGTTPSDKNNAELLRGNLMPYALTGHVHEREVSLQLGHPLEFMPHVASHFRGLTITANLHLSIAFEREEVLARYRGRYAGEPLVRVQDKAPWVSRIAGQHHVEIGGFTLSDDGKRLVVVATEDNLLKGAATQALQNLNLAFGLDELAGIPVQEEVA
ncbi:N-acetyl-gamma-glutamyl-phosphate reductase [Thermomonas paludicola]|uniref:N-acetyl-gamma-glutamyl-phosphate reductase n=1 Tax=Thermomonas paludicola TaxID=2884874 RepID=UPI00211487A6|nr:N-acetyl-gamma-glutamyl-phosphate reductase [Thermomonas paludicola]